MPDLYMPTVVQPDIPLGDITWLERLVLFAVFQSEARDGTIYFFAERGPADPVRLSITALREALAACADIPSRTRDVLAARLEAAGAADTELEIELATGLPWPSIFQDIVHRSDTVRRVTAVTSFMAARMRPDGFGGMVVLVTAHQVLTRDTGDLLAELHALADRREAEGDGPSDVHVLLQLREDAVRAAAQRMIAAHGAATLTPGDLSDADVRAACLTVAEWDGRTEEREAAEHAAALLAIAGAARRVGRSV